MSPTPDGMERHGSGHLHRPHPALVLAVVVGAAGLSLLFQDTLKADPHGWLQWGRSLALGDGAFSTAGYPS